MSKKIIFLAVLIVGIIGAIYYLNSMKATSSDKNSVEENKIQNPGQLNNQNIPNGGTKEIKEYVPDEQAVKEKSLKFQEAPELAGIAGYINTNPDIKIKDLKGKVVLVDFWTYTCINCIRTLPYLKSWHEQYNDEGLVIIGVHTPEFEFEKDYDNVKSAAEKYQLEYSIVQDNDYSTWRAYKNRYWPRKYLVDIDGFIRYDHIGEGSYDETEKMIRELLKERMGRSGDGKIEEDMAAPSNVADVEFEKVGTPEIYFGYEFTRGNFGNPEGLEAEKIIDYKIPIIVKPNNVYLDGKWKINKDNVELVGENGRIILGYDAKTVNIVAGSASGSEVRVTVDTRYVDDSSKGIDVLIQNNKSSAKVKDERLYNLVDYEYGKGLLELRINGKGFKIYTFTFG